MLGPLGPLEAIAKRPVSVIDTHPVSSLASESILSPAVRRRLQCAVGAFLFISYAYFTPSTQWNENTRFNLTRSLVERGELDIDPYHENTGDKSFRDGHYYTDKAPGISFLAVPGYALLVGMRKLSGQELPRQEVIAEVGERDPETGRKLRFPLIDYNPALRRGLYMANLLSNGLLAALAGALLFGFLLRREEALAPALFGTAAYGLGTMAWPYATLFYGHQAAGSLLLMALILGSGSGSGSGSASGTGSRSESKKSTGSYLGLGAVLGLVVAVDYPSAVPAALVGLYLALGREGAKEKARALALLAVGALPIGVGLAAYHTVCFGGPFSLGYEHLATERFAEGMSRGLYGITWPRPMVLVKLLAGPHRGILYTSPVLLLTVVGLWKLWKRGEHGLVCIAASTLVYFLLLNSAYYMWDGGAAFSARHTIPALALLAPSLGAAFPTSGDGPARTARVGCWVFFAVSAASMLAATAVGPEAPMWVYDPMVEHIWPSFISGELALNLGSTNLGLLLGLDGLASLLPLLALWALSGATFYSLLPEDEPAVDVSESGRDEASAAEGG
jgi:MFS family permease